MPGSNGALGLVGWFEALPLFLTFVGALQIAKHSPSLLIHGTLTLLVSWVLVP